MKLVSLIAIALLLVACATTPVSLKDSKPVPSDRLLAFQVKGEDKTATLTVIRDEGITNSACYIGLWVNGTLAARLATAESAVLRVEPGEALLRVGIDPLGAGLCAYGKGTNWTQRETTLHPGDNKMFRITTNVDASSVKMDIIRAEAD